MPNRHFGEIGDVWKHLPLATLLEIESPTHYWETHSGSAIYSLDKLEEDHQWKKNYGVLYYHKFQNQSSILSLSKYSAILNKFSEEDNLTHTPGSPLLSFLSCKRIEHLTFCDIDPLSLQSISKELLMFEESKKVHLDLQQKDGISTLMENISKWNSKSIEQRSQVFVFIDPYDIFYKDTDTKSVSSIEVFSESLKMGMKSALWYGFDSSEDRKLKKESVVNDLKLKGINPRSIWWGEVFYTNIDRMNLNPGIKGGCSMVVGNCSQKATDLCSQYGEALESIYRTAMLPDGTNGSLKFDLISIN